MSKRWADSGFGRALKIMREQQGLTLVELAGMVGCHPMTVSKLERGAQEPAWPLVVMLATALGVAADEFRNPALTAKRTRKRKDG